MGDSVATCDTRTRKTRAYCNCYSQWRQQQGISRSDEALVVESSQQICYSVGDLPNMQLFADDSYLIGGSPAANRVLPAIGFYHQRLEGDGIVIIVVSLGFFCQFRIGKVFE